MFGRLLSFACLGDEHIKAAKGNSAEQATEVVPIEIVMVKNGVCNICKTPCKGDKSLAKISNGSVFVFMCESECFKVYVFSSRTAGDIACISKLSKFASRIS